MFTFKQFISEDISTEIAALQTQISQIQARKNQANKPLDQQLVRLQQMLAIKQKQAQNQPPAQQPPQATPGTAPAKPVV